MIVSKREFILMFAVLGLLSGTLFNVNAIVQNDCRMPVQTEEYEFSTARHFTYTSWDEVNVPYFTDFIYIKWAFISIGDILLVISLALLAIWVILLPLP